MNPADLVTKHVAQAAVTKHFTSLDMWVEWGRAASAPKLSMMLQDIGEPRYAMHFSGLTSDAWIVDGEEAMRVHHKARRELFTPLHVAGAPPSKGFTPMRIIKGNFIDKGEMFKRADTRAARASVHTDLRDDEVPPASRCG